MRFTYSPERVCSKQFLFDVDEESRVINGFAHAGGCPGNLEGISRLIRGKTIDEVIDCFEDMPICSGSKVSSCPEQIRNALVSLRAQLDGGEAPKAAPGRLFGIFGR